MRTVTFYSYKGGTGRTLLMANIAVAAVQLGRRVVVVDLDLEAPGLAYKLRPLEASEERGVVDWLTAYREGHAPAVAEVTVPCDIVQAPLRPGGELLMIPAGKAPSPSYFDLLSRLHLDEWIESDGVTAFQELKRRIAAEFNPDYLLIDSRTGITATNSVTTRVLADTVVVLTLDSPEQQEGTRSVLRTLQPLTSLDTGEPLDLHVVLSRFAGGAPDDPTARTSEEQRCLNALRRFLNEPAWPPRNTLDIRDPHMHLVRMDTNLARREFIVLDQAKRYRGSLFDENLAIAATVLSGLVGAPDSEQIAEELELVHSEGRSLGSSDDGSQPDLLTQAENLRQQLGNNPDVAVKLAETLTRISAAAAEIGNNSQALESIEEAVSVYRRLVEADGGVFKPALADTLVAYANFLSEAARHEEALRHVEEAYRLYASLGDSAALASVSELLPKLRTRHAEGQLRRSTIRRMLGDREQAIALGDQLIAEYGDDPALREQVARALVNKAITLRQLGHSEQAIDVYDQIDTRYGHDPTPALREQVARALVNKAITLGELGQSEQAIDVYDRIDTRYRDDPTPALREQVAQALVNKAITLGQLDQSEQEIRTYDQIDTLYGDDPALREQVASALFNKGYRLGLLGQSEQAIGVYDQIDTRYGDDPTPALREQVARALVNKGYRLGQLGQPEQEIRVYDQIDTRYGHDPTPALREPVARALVNKAVTLGQLGQYEQAIDVYDQIDTRYGHDPTPALREQVANAASNQAQVAFARRDDVLGSASALQALRVAGDRPGMAPMRAEANFYLYAHDPVSRAAAGRRLQELLGSGVSTGAWSFQPNIDRLRADNDPRVDLIEALAHALAAGDPTGLDSYEEWRGLSDEQHSQG